MRRHMSKLNLILMGCVVLIILTVFHARGQVNCVNQPVLCPDGCQCSKKICNEIINGRDASCEYLQIIHDTPNHCNYQKDEKICRFYEDWDCDDENPCTEDKHIENSVCLYTPKSCESGDGCCPVGCVGKDTDCTDPDECLETCSNTCSNVCSSFGELCDFICDICTGPDCQQRCSDCKVKETNLCDNCQPTCEETCTVPVCTDTSCNANCSYVVGTPCYNSDPDCFGCVNGICHPNGGLFCNNCKWESNNACGPLTPGYCEWDGNCVIMHVCGWSSNKYCEGVDTDKIECECPTDNYCHLTFIPPLAGGTSTISRSC